jgi:hypothetical protein
MTVPTTKREFMATFARKVFFLQFQPPIQCFLSISISRITIAQISQSHKSHQSYTIAHSLSHTAHNLTPSRIHTIPISKSHPRFLTIPPHSFCCTVGHHHRMLLGESARAQPRVALGQARPGSQRQSSGAQRRSFGEPAVPQTSSPVPPNSPEPSEWDDFLFSPERLGSTPLMRRKALPQLNAETKGASTPFRTAAGVA